MKNIIIRTLGGGNIGYGHFFRCLSLSKAIRKTCGHIGITFLINDKLVDMLKGEGFDYIISNSLEDDTDIIADLEIDLFILDTYLGDDDYLKLVKRKTGIMLIDDNNDIYDSRLVDIIYNGNIHAKKLNYQYVDNQLRLLGAEYLIMKEEYWDYEENDLKDKDGILITTGGSDEHGIALDIMNSIKKINVNIRIIIGPGYKESYVKQIESEKSDNVELIYSPSSLKDYIKRSKVVITAGGSTVYEVLSQRSTPIIFSLADNQDLICEELRKMEVSYLGKYPDIDYFKTEVLLKSIFEKSCSCNPTFNLIDGKGALRVADEISSILRI